MERFLSQPFFVAEAFTGSPGTYVSVDDTVRSFKEIVEGKHDDLPERAFYMKGSIDEVTQEAGSDEDEDEESEDVRLRRQRRRQLGREWLVAPSPARSSRPRARSSTRRWRWSPPARRPVGWASWPTTRL